MGYWHTTMSYSSGGLAFPNREYRRLRMPRINDDLLHCSVYLYTSVEEARRGTRSGGSGFLLGVPFGMTKLRPWEEYQSFDANLPSFLYVVTNKHVIEAGFTTVRFNTMDGATDAVSLTSWTKHPASDLALHRIPFYNYRYKALLYIYLMREDEVALLDIGVGDGLVSIGRFINHEGRQGNRPVARFGEIAMMPSESEKIEMSYNTTSGEAKISQASYLIESRTLPGYSGSPVFTWIPAWELRESLQEGRRRAGERFLETGQVALMRLLGVAWGFVRGTEKVEVKIGGKLITLNIPINTGMMGAVPSWKLLELLDMPEVVQDRIETIREEEENPPAGRGC
jgi:hypothetical protein